jgi:(1->4)-alpha-D-glucan 1-alpha-D-glucosylmutase
MMKLPAATYRIQFCSSFSFGDAERIIGYLHDLGITDIYASPVLRSRKGSTHGYDITDPGSFDPELGGKKGLERLASTVAAHGMGWLQDIVPNHMAFHQENSRLMDVLEKGEHSPFSGYFDILWDIQDEKLRGKLMAPFLGESLDSCLRKGEIVIGLDQSGFSILYPLHLELRTYPVQCDRCA